MIGAALAAVVIVAFGWLLGVQPQLDAAATAGAQRQTVDQTNDRYRAVLEKLKSDHEKLPQLNAELATLAASVPADTDSSPFVKELNALAGSNGVTIQALTFSDAQSYKPVVPPAAPTPTSTPSSSATPSPSPSPTPTAVAAPATVTNPLVTSANFFASPVQMTVRGTLASALNFIEGAQKGERLFLVTSLSSTPTTTAGAAAGSVDATIGGFIYAITPASTAKAGSASGAAGGTPAQAAAEK